MLTQTYRKLYWTRNATPFLGFAPGELIVMEYVPGGGFAGHPQGLELGLASGVADNQPEAPLAEWPKPSSSVRYLVGGRLWAGYHYYVRERSTNVGQ